MSKIKIPKDMSVGTQYPTGHYGIVTILEYLGCKKVKIRFEDTGVVTLRPAGDIRRGFLRDPSKKRGTTRPNLHWFVGAKHVSPRYGEVVVKEYLHSKNIKVIFTRTGYETTISKSSFVEDEIVDPYQRKVCSLGVNDLLHYREIEIPHKYYVTWRSMLTRCYSSSAKPCYKLVEVCEDWLLFSNFYRWMKDQDWEGKVLDKDLLSPRGGKVYSPSTCTFISEELNAFLTTSIGEQTKGYYFNKKKELYQVQYSCPNTKRNVYVGVVATEEGAKDLHREYKQRALKVFIEEKVPEELKTLVETYIANTALG